MPRAGNWYKICYPELADELLSQQERQKDRIWFLLNRYGILFRELLNSELPMFRGTALLRTLRLIDLSGEIYSGCFFQGIIGLQFIAPELLSISSPKSWHRFRGASHRIKAFLSEFLRITRIK